VSLKDATILVTNAADGVGLACAHALAAAGASIMFSARDDETVAAAEADLQQHGVPVYGMCADPARSRDIEKLLGETQRVFGGLRGAVAVPATPRGGTLLEIDDATFDRILSAGVRAAHIVCQRSARVLIAAGRGGSLTIVGPAAGPALAGPAAINGALAALARQFAVELQPHAVRANAVIQGGDGRDAAVAALVCFLVDDEAAPLSGAVIDLQSPTTARTAGPAT